MSAIQPAPVIKDLASLDLRVIQIFRGIPVFHHFTFDCEYFPMGIPDATALIAAKDRKVYHYGDPIILAASMKPFPQREMARAGFLMSSFHDRLNGIGRELAYYADATRESAMLQAFDELVKNTDLRVIYDNR